MKTIAVGMTDCTKCKYDSALFNMNSITGESSLFCSRCGYTKIKLFPRLESGDIYSRKFNIQETIPLGAIVWRELGIKHPTFGYYDNEEDFQKFYNSNKQNLDICMYTVKIDNQWRVTDLVNNTHKLYEEHINDFMPILTGKPNAN